MTYYTIPFKTGGTECCTECQPDPSECSCDDVCCDFDAQYSGKTLTVAFDYSDNPSASGQSDIIQINASFSYAGGGIFNYLAGSSSFAAFFCTTPPLSCFTACSIGPYYGITENPTSASISCSLVGGVPVYVCQVASPTPILSRGSNPIVKPYPAVNTYAASLLANCGFTVGCDYATTVVCSATYVSSCFSIYSAAEVCETTYANYGCTGPVSYIGSYTWTFSATIA